ncbi:MAG: hypothetical protein ACPGED_02885 [Flavobacteriales bacterium]
MFLFSLSFTGQITNNNSLLLAKTANYEPQNDFFNVGFGVSSWGLPIYATYEKPMFMDRMSLVVGGSFRSKTEKYSFLGSSTKWRHTIIGLEGGVNYYVDEFIEGKFAADFDLYASARLRYFVWNTKIVDNNTGVDYEYSGSGNGGLGIGLNAGGRYHFNENVSLHVEAGYGSVISGGRVGVSFRL